MKRFKSLARLDADKPTIFKYFKIGIFHYIACLARSYIHLFKWEEKLDALIVRESSIGVYNARSFDVFNNKMNTYLLVSEEFQLPLNKVAASRVLTFNISSGKFEHQNNFLLPIAAATKVVSFTVFGKLHAALIFYQSDGNYPFYLHYSSSIHCSLSLLFDNLQHFYRCTKQYLIKACASFICVKNQSNTFLPI